MLKSIRNGSRFAACWPASTARHRRQKLAVELLAERVAPDQAIRFDGDVDDGRPGMIAELFQRPIDMNCRFIAARCARLLEGRQDHGSAGALKRLDKCPVRRRVGRRAEIDVEYDVADVGCFAAAAANRRGDGAAKARRRFFRSRGHRSRSRRRRRWPDVASRRTANRSAHCGSAPCQPDDSTIASAAATKICGR